MVELFAADLTRKLLESRVCVHVVVQITSGLEGCVADLTHKRPGGGGGREEERDWYSK